MRANGVGGEGSWAGQVDQVGQVGRALPAAAGPADLAGASAAAATAAGPAVPAVPAGARLRLALDQLAPGVGRVSARLWGAGCDVPRYLGWLRTSHQLVRATTPLLAEAAQECLRRADPLSAGLAPWFAGQLVEEHGHDRWLLEDYAAAGGDPGEVPDALPGGAVARFAGAPAYWIRHVHPLALLGHTALLEWYPPAPATPAALAARLGLPPAAFRTMAAHTGLDARHGGALREFLDSLRLTPRQHRLLLTAAATAADGLAEVIGELLAGERARHPAPGPDPDPVNAPAPAPA